MRTMIESKGFSEHIPTTSSMCTSADFFLVTMQVASISVEAKMDRENAMMEFK